MVAVGVRQRLQQATGRSPAASVLKTCLCATILPFPVVKAWSVWNKNEGPGDGAFEKFAKTVRFKKVSTEAERKALVQLLYEMDHLYKNGDPSEFNKIYEALSKHKVMIIHCTLCRDLYEYIEHNYLAQRFHNEGS